MSKIVSKAMRELARRTPIEIQLKVIIQSHFIAKGGGTFFMPADDTSEEYQLALEANTKALEGSNELIEQVLEAIEMWKQNGMP